MVLEIHSQVITGGILMAIGIIGLSLLFLTFIIKLLAAFTEVRKEVHSVSHDMRTFRVSQLEAIATDKNLAKRNSPARITPSGEAFINETGMKGLVEKHLEAIIAQLKKRKIRNIYQLDAVLMEVIEEVAENASEIDRVEIAAFKKGFQLDLLFYLASLYLRDQAALGLNIEAPTPEETQPELSLR